jgi:hypothetical protein
MATIILTFTDHDNGEVTVIPEFVGMTAEEAHAKMSPATFLALAAYKEARRLGQPVEKTISEERQ